MSNLDKWIEAVLCVADANGMDDRQEIDTWPWDVKARYPLLTVGDIREWQARFMDSCESVATINAAHCFDVEDASRLMRLPAGTKLYTHPARQAVSVPGGPCMRNRT